MDEYIQKLISGGYEEFCKSVDTFLKIHENSTRFEALDKNNLREKVWKVLFEHLTNPNYLSVHHNCLAALRILSRDKTDLNKLITNELIQIILKKAQLTTDQIDQQVSYDNVTIESLKLLCNLLFNSAEVKRLTFDTSFFTCIIKRISSHSPQIPHEVKLFDTRILFLITALNVLARGTVKNQLKGDIHLINTLNQISSPLESDENYILTNDNILLSCEILKTLFNLYIQSGNESDEQQKQIASLTKICCKLLVMKHSSNFIELHRNIVNLLTVIPHKYCSMLAWPIQDDKCKEIYENMDMSVISVLLEFLDNRLNCNVDIVENLSPIVTALIRVCTAERLIRKYIRLQILPPLKDVMIRPEEGTTLRAKLCKLLTSPITELRDLVAEFLFILCKENVNRMIKYTGYGNAAGMFANKGLLGRKSQKTNYSSESDDSETEEYLEYKERINPITGCYEQPKPNPLEGMSEEQKEYEAMKLVGLVDKLTREGVIRPCRIGEDGRPKAIDHVLELQNELPKNNFPQQDSDSDS